MDELNQMLAETNPKKYGKLVKKGKKGKKKTTSQTTSGLSMNQNVQTSIRSGDHSDPISKRSIREQTDEFLETDHH